MTFALKYVKAAPALAMSYLSVVWSILYGYYIFGDVRPALTHFCHLGLLVQFVQAQSTFGSLVLLTSAACLWQRPLFQKSRHFDAFMMSSLCEADGLTHHCNFHFLRKSSQGRLRTFANQAVSPRANIMDTIMQPAYPSSLHT